MCLLIPVVGCGGSSRPVAVTVTATSTTVDGTNAVSLTATVANDKKAAGVSWTVTGGGTLSNNTTTSATLTAPAATSSAQTLTVTATSIADATKAGTLTITVPAMPAVTSTDASLAGMVGTAYSVTLQASGGIAPYKWSLAGSTTLPSCLTLSSAGVITTTSGTAPTASCAGTYSNLTFTVTDSGTPTALSVTSVPLSITISAAPAISFTGTVPATGTFGVAYAGSAAATGGAGALTYSISAGALPADLSLNASTGAITGTPSKAADVGTFNFTVQATDAYGDSNTQAYVIVVTYPALTVTLQTLPTGYANSNYPSTQLAATGGSGTGYAWAVAGGSSLPAGIALSAGGVLSGKPTATGTTNFTVTVTDSASHTANGNFSITVDAGVSITTGTTLPTGYAGSSYSQQLAATGGTGTGFTWAVANGSTLPGGLTLSTGGLLSGTPAATGTPSFSITVTDSANNTATAAFTLTISAGVSVTTSSLPSGYQGTAYAGTTMAATGGTGTGYTWTWTAASGSNYPTGLNLSSVGAISGTPTVAGTFNMVFTVTDSANNTKSATLSLTVAATLAVTTTTLPSGSVGVAYSQQLAASGGTGGNQWSTDGAGTTSLSAIGLALGTNGVVSGASPTAGTATFTATVTDSAAHTATASVSVTVYAALTVTTTTLPSTNAGVAYSQTLAAAGGTGTGYTWQVTSGGAQLTAVGLSVSTGGLVSGSTPIAGTANFTVQVTDSASTTATKSLTVTVYSGLSLPAPNPSSLPSTGTTGVGYTGTISASGGSGSYSWSVTGLSDGLTSGSSGGTLTISGTPTAAATVSFNVQLTDSTTSNSVSQTGYSIVVSNPAPLSLPSQNPSSLPSATVGQSYSGSIDATGGVGPYTWKINGITVTSLALTNGLTATNSGGATLSISGTPTSTTSVPLTSVTVTDSEGAPATAGPYTYSIAVNSAGQNVSGQISLANYCGGSPTLPTFTVSISDGASFNATTTTDSSGNYMFSSVPNGTYTITPSITGPSSAFLPATLTSVTVNNANVTGENFGVSLGYNVSGAVSYTGSQSGQVYVQLVNTNCSGTGGSGTSMSAPGSYTVRGVPPGSYTVQVWRDPLGYGFENAEDPSGSAATSVVTADATGADVTMNDPSVTTPGSGPTLNSISPISGGVVISYKPIQNNNGVEQVSGYTIQWSSDSTFATGVKSYSMPATGNGSNVWFLNNRLTGNGTGFSNGTAYYFRARGELSAGTVHTGWTVFGGGTPTGVTPNAPSGGNTVSGVVTIPSTDTVTPGATLYVGFFDQGTGNVYATAIASPSNTSANNFTLQVPSGSNYFFFGILDQTNNGVISPGDVSNTDSNAPPVAITGAQNENLTLPSNNVESTVMTGYFQQTNSSGTTSGYTLQLLLKAGIKLPVSVTLTGGPNVTHPVDISNLCQDCGHPQFNYFVGLGNVTPTVGDTYTFDVKYSDATEDAAVTAKVTGVLGASQLATSMAPSGTTSVGTTPTFTWTYPSSASSYTYRFYLSDNSGNNLWQIPGSNSNSKSNGFTSTEIPGTLTWDADPTNSNNHPTVPSLTGGATYNWSILTQDNNGNSASNMVYYVP